MIPKSNVEYDGGSPNVPEVVRDRYYSQDWVRDYWHSREQALLPIEDMMQDVPCIVEGGVIVQGSAGNLCHLSKTVGYVKKTVRIPDSFASLPPTSTTEQVRIIRIEVPELTDFAPSGYATGGPVNYFKIRHKNIDSKQRQKAKDVATYYYEQSEGYEIITDTTPPTDEDLLICRFTFVAGVFNFVRQADRQKRFAVPDEHNGRILCNARYAHMVRKTQVRTWQPTRGIAHDEILTDGIHIWARNGNSWTAIHIADGVTRTSITTTVGPTSYSGIYFDGIHIWATAQNLGNVTFDLINVKTYAIDYTFTVSTGGGVQLAWDGIYMWWCGSAGAMGRIKKSTQVSTPIVNPSGAVVSIVFDGVRMQTLHTSSWDINGWDIETAGNVANAVIGAGPFTFSNLEWDGKYLWVNDQAGGTTYMYNPIALALYNSFASNAFTRLLFDGRYMWGLATSINAVDHYDVNNNVNVAAIWSTIGSVTAPLYIAFDGTNVWIGDGTTLYHFLKV